jgi:hypothetical protein
MSKNNITKNKKQNTARKPSKIKVVTILVGESSVYKLTNLRAFKGVRTQMKGDDLAVTINDFIPKKNTILHITYLFKGFSNYTKKS